MHSIQADPETKWRWGALQQLCSFSRKCVYEMSAEILDQIDTDDVIGYAIECSAFWDIAQDKKILFRFLDCADYEDVKEWLKKERVYKTKETR